MKNCQMSKSGITTTAFAMKSRPDTLIFQGESAGGHQNAGESREEQNLGAKTWAPEMSRI
jgi:hypothetical protein